MNCSATKAWAQTSSLAWTTAWWRGGSPIANIMAVIKQDPTGNSSWTSLSVKWQASKVQFCSEKSDSDSWQQESESLLCEILYGTKLSIRCDKFSIRRDKISIWCDKYCLVFPYLSQIRMVVISINTRKHQKSLKQTKSILPLPPVSLTAPVW